MLKPPTRISFPRILWVAKNRSQFYRCPELAPVELTVTALFCVLRRVLSRHSRMIHCTSPLFLKGPNFESERTNVGFFGQNPPKKIHNLRVVFLLNKAIQCGHARSRCPGFPVAKKEEDGRFRPRSAIHNKWAPSRLL